MAQLKGKLTIDTRVLFDGAFGTYYALKYDTRELPELANTLHPERVLAIRKEYIEAGAQFIRTKTFASNMVTFEGDFKRVDENLRQGYRLACQAAKEYEQEICVVADIGEIPLGTIKDKEAIAEEYKELCKVFLEEGANAFVFETFSDMEELRPAIEMIGDRALVIVQFLVNQFGYSNSGLSARKLVQKAEQTEGIDAIGFNCGVGPAHMQQIIRSVQYSGAKLLTALPNAGYPQNISNRMFFSNQNIEYFVSKMSDIALEGVAILGGCCGTTPEYIRRMKQHILWEADFDVHKKVSADALKKTQPTPKDYSFYADKAGKKLIAVELAPPLGSDDEKLMDAAHMLKKSGVDVLTFPDSPSGRTRADSILMAEKVARETGMCVMPHVCCRDKNAIAMRSLLLGAYINHIHNFLVITGDPIPSMVRSTVKSVFNFDSTGLMQIMNDMNEEQFVQEPVCYGGAINQGRRNLDIEIGRVKKKMEFGASFFFTQPVFSREGVERLRKIKEETGARILCGIMPLVSLKNATFMKNEMTGIDVTDEVLMRYHADMTKEEGEQAGVQLAKEVIAMTEDFVDGYYFSFPFNRVSMLEKIWK